PVQHSAWCLRFRPTPRGQGRGGRNLGRPRPLGLGGREGREGREEGHRPGFLEQELTLFATMRPVGTHRRVASSSWTRREGPRGRERARRELSTTPVRTWYEGGEVQGHAAPLGNTPSADRRVRSRGGDRLIGARRSRQRRIDRSAQNSGHR